MFVHVSRAGLHLPRVLMVFLAMLLSVALVLSMSPYGAWADEPPGTAVPNGDLKGGADAADEVLERPDGVSAAVTARLKGKPVEDVSRRTESSRTLVNPDGTLTDEISSGPVRVRDEATGAWADVDDTFVKQQDGTYAPKASPTDVVISGGGSTTAATVTLEDGNSLAVTWPERLPAPTVEGGVASFKVSASADLLLVMTGTGVAARVRLNERPAEDVAAFDLGLVTRGLKVAEVAAGDATGLSFTDAQDGTKVGSVGRMVAWDARTDQFGDPVEVVPVESDLSKAVVKGKRRSHELSLSTAEGFLDDPEVEYPVIVDPDISAVGISRDTWIRSGTTTAQGADHRLMVGRLADSTNTNHIVSLIQWNPDTLAGKNILSATAGFYQYGAGSCAARAVNLHPVTSSWTEASTVWTNRPSIAAGAGYSTSFTTNRGRPGCAGTAGTNGFVTVNVIKMAQYWAANKTKNLGMWMNVPSANVNDVTFERRWCSRHYDPTYEHCKDATRRPYLSIRYNGPPGTAVVPTPTTGSRTTDGVTVSSTNKPTWSTVATDAESSRVTYSFEVRTSASATTNVTTCTTAQVASGAKASCTPGVALTNGATYVVRARAVDQYGLGGSYSAWRTFKVNTTAPAISGVTCTNGYAVGAWFDPRGAATAECAIATTGAYDVQWKVNGSAVKTTKVAGAVSTGTISIPQDGYTKIEAAAFSSAGLSTGWKAYGFGSGSSTLLQPQKDDRSTSTFPVEAAAPPGATSAKIKWRYAPETEGDLDTGWKDATALVKGDTGAAWTGAVTSDSELSKSGALIWDASKETGIDKPALVEVRVEFSYPGGTVKPSPLQRVHVVPHAFGGSFPTQEFGPGQAALFTGEFQLSETDVEVPGYGSSLSLGRSHLSLAGQPAGPAGVFGPGWVADLSGPEEGIGGFVVDDRRDRDGTIQLVDPEGETYVYLHEAEKSGANLTGAFVGVGETALEEDKLAITAIPATGSDVDQRMVLTEWDGTKTSWVRVVSTKVWVTEQVVAPEATATTTYAHNTDGTVSWIFAPAPAGVQCNVTTQAKGCRAVNLLYEGTGANKRLVEVVLHTWNPKPKADGVPGAGAAMDAVSVQKYAYNAAGQLTAAWNPRIADGEAALKTTYTYSDTSARPKLATLSEPGLKPWQFTYPTDGDDAGKITTITRVQDAAIGGIATWTVDYDLALAANGDGLPNLSAEVAQAWGQPAADVPVAGTAVFEPDATGAGAERNEYASLSYYTRAGRSTNTATYGAGAWQISTTRYDAKGNSIWTLSPEGRRLALEEGAGDDEKSAGAAEEYATHTVYNDDITNSAGEVVLAAGTRVEQTWDPTREVVLDNGDTVEGRTLTQTLYDDEADPALMPGRPTQDVPAGGYGLAVEERSSVTTKPSPGGDGQVHDTKRTRYRYDKVNETDGDGWALRTPTRTLVENATSPSGWDTTITRFDIEGKTIQTRTPEGVEKGEQTRWTNTVYYTHDASAARSECRNKAEWVGMVCWTGPAAQPAGPEQPIPVEHNAGYSMLLAPTRVEETAGSATRAEVTTFDQAGRTIQTKTALSGLISRAVAPVATTYDPTTGLVASVSNGTSARTSSYDSWGRVIQQTDGNGHTATTRYDAAGRVAESHDGQAITTYTYDGTDSRGRKERRGLVTALDTVVSGGSGLFAGAYDAAGNLVEQVYPGDVKATSAYDIAGAQRSLTYAVGDEAILSFTAEVDADSRIRRQLEASGSTQDYHYDDRDRLAEVRDTREGACTVRAYGFSADSNRTSLATYAADVAGGCQTTTVAGAVSTAFDSADRLDGTGDVYDELGRTLIVPAAATDTPEAGDLSIGYYANDMVATLTQDGRSQDFSLDVADRLAHYTTSVDGTVTSEVTNAYDDGGDSPAWTETKSRADATSAWTTLTQRYVSGINGDLALIEPSDGPVTVQLANLHDDVVATVDITGDQAGTPAGYTEYSEYGTAITPASTPDRYGWLGAKTRQGVGIVGGLTLMGVRLYNPITGRFLSRDPIPGGNDNTYTYPADPINKTDLSGAAVWIPIALACVRYCYKAYKAVKSARTASKAAKVARPHNKVRRGPIAPGRPYRVSYGPAPKHWRKMPASGQSLYKRHIHIERKVVTYTRYRNGYSTTYRIPGRTKN